MSDATTTLRLFVYGTLKRGQCNHVRFFGSDAHVQPAQVRGRLVQLRQGYPMLVVPETDVIRRATPDFAADVALTGSLAPEAALVDAVAMETASLVQGEMVTVSDAVQRLPAIDALEDFDAASGLGLYRRVLIRTVAPSSEIVWTYIAPDGSLPPGAIEWGARWP